MFLVGACACAMHPAIADSTIPPDVVVQANRYASDAHTLLDSQLVDYPSARFRNVRAHYSRRTLGGEHALTFCGEVNAKNTMGGYTGWAHFVLLPGDDPEFLIESDGLAGTFVSNMCTRDEKNWLSTDFTAAFAPPSH